jgi:hypothetical protein
MTTKENIHYNKNDLKQHPFNNDYISNLLLNDSVTSL